MECSNECRGVSGVINRWLLPCMHLSNFFLQCSMAEELYRPFEGTVCQKLGSIVLQLKEATRRFCPLARLCLHDAFKKSQCLRSKFQYP